MDLVFCINKNSFPASDERTGKILFDDAVQGVLAMFEPGEDRCFFYYDSNNESLLDLNIAENLTYADFLASCDIDLQTFLWEVEDKSPALDALSNEQFEEMASCDFYVPNEAADKYPDVYGLAWVTSGYLLSLATEQRWNKQEVRINKTDEGGRYTNDFLILKNISNESHGKLHNEEAKTVNLEQLIAPHIATQIFISWFKEQSKENQKIIGNKFRLAIEKDFQGGKPLFDSLTNSEGVREMRMFAYPGGAIRLLFKHLKDTQQVFLLGFIKHGNSEGYVKYIPEAESLYNQYNIS